MARMAVAEITEAGIFFSKACDAPGETGCATLRDDGEDRDPAQRAVGRTS